jgi:thiamine biosynthesis lipoprotein
MKAYTVVGPTNFQPGFFNSCDREWVAVFCGVLHPNQLSGKVGKPRGVCDKWDNIADTIASMTAAAPNVLERIRATARLERAGDWHELSFAALGSPCRVRFASVGGAAKALPDVIIQWVADFEARYSRFIPTSLVSRITEAAGREWVQTDPETERLLAMCHEAHFITRGTFDPTALPLIRLWNWKANPPVVPDDAAIAEAMKKVGWRKVQRAPGKVLLPEAGMALDLGGIGKEYAVDQVAQLVMQSGATSVLVDFGHDVRVQGLPPDKKPAWHIGLEDPKQPGRCWTGLAVNNQSVATSGDYLRNFVLNGKRYGHILDVRTGRPVANGCLAVSVIAGTCTMAGMLSTTAFVLGAEEGVRLLDATYQTAGCIVTERGTFTSRRFYDVATT